MDQVKKTKEAIEILNSKIQNLHRQVIDIEKALDLANEEDKSAARYIAEALQRKRKHGDKHTKEEKEALMVKRADLKAQIRDLDREKSFLIVAMMEDKKRD